MENILDRRLVLVAGKGGTGRPRSRPRSAWRQPGAAGTVVVEVAEQQRLLGLFGKGARDHDEVRLDSNLFGLSIDPQRAMEEWLRHQLRSGTLAGLLGGSRIFQLLTAAAPGVSELVTMGKIWDLAQLERRTGGSVFDIAIVDARLRPGTAWGCSERGTYARIARAGPVAPGRPHRRVHPRSGDHRDHRRGAAGRCRCPRRSSSRTGSPRTTWRSTRSSSTA